MIPRSSAARRVNPGSALTLSSSTAFRFPAACGEVSERNNNNNKGSKIDFVELR